jgi:tRNA dimethylallyltransferase
MLELGLVDELRSLRRRYALDSALPSMRSVGYRQAWGFLEGAYGEREMRDRALAATRQLAKRQLTWLRAMPFDAVLDPLAADAAERFCGLAQAVAAEGRAA